MSMRDFTITRTPYSFSYTTDSRVPVSPESREAPVCLWRNMA